MMGVQRCPECHAVLIYIYQGGVPSLFCKECGWNEDDELIEREEERRDTDGG